MTAVPYLRGINIPDGIKSERNGSVRLSYKAACISCYPASGTRIHETWVAVNYARYLHIVSHASRLRPAPNKNMVRGNDSKPRL
jgi:hypothetical protein